jgi:hypothetical protein
MNLAEGTDAIVELVKDLEEALAIVRVKAWNTLNLTLRKAKLELEITTTNTSKAGTKIEFGISLDASIKRQRGRTHVVSLILEPIPSSSKMGGDEAHDLADSILALAALKNKVAALKSTDFKIGDMELEVHFARKTSGGLQIFCGGEGESENTQKVTLSFRE